MPRWFNTAGPCKPDIHYMLPAAARIPQAQRMIEQQAYFVIHAPRQTGKTTTMMALARELTASGQYAAVLLSVEVGAAFNTDPGTAELAMLGEWRNAASLRLPAGLQPPPWPAEAAGQRLRAALQRWAQAAPQPLVLFIDEIDALQDVTLISVLRQLRSGYADRPHGFPWSVALIGLRDVRDYKIASGGSERLNTASPFNITTRSLSLDNFTPDEVATLYQQHTGDTGQVFATDATSLDAFLDFWRQHGQPLLKTAPYHEIAPHLVIMAFLHRVANAGGSLEREYAIGSGRMDLLLRYGDVRLAIELKTWRPGERDPLTQGLAQLDAYLAGLGLSTGWLVIFDQRPDPPPIRERTSAEELITPGGRRVTLIRG